MQTEHIGPVEQVMYVGQPELKHSGIGIASFVISLLAGLVLFMGVGFAVVLAAVSQNVEIDDRSPVFVVIGLFVLLALVLDVVALGFGIGGLCQRDRKKVFAAIGTILSGLAILAIGGLMILGMTAK